MFCICLEMMGLAHGAGLFNMYLKDVYAGMRISDSITGGSVTSNLFRAHPSTLTPKQAA